MAGDFGGFDQNAPEQEDDFGGNFGGGGGDDGSSIFDVGLFSGIASLFGLLQKSQPVGLGLSVIGRGLDAVFGTSKTVSSSIAGLFADDGPDPFDDIDGRGGGPNPGLGDNFAGPSDPFGPTDHDDGGGDARLLRKAKTEDRRDTRRAKASPSTPASPALAAPVGAPTSRLALAVAGRNRPRTLFSTETGLKDTLGG